MKNAVIYAGLLTLAAVSVAVHLAHVARASRRHAAAMRNRPRAALWPDPLAEQRALLGAPYAHDVN